ncbi:hypothetical protein FGO68_gene14638 [Halteria grandinella]|uniref:Uncharacterized protein n=1 Tax=Halteria grandinella TaxID=5974 RepID=A0A8J8NH76_HALGN|nr:hypothetical protein FGO68_gene14638 [Halteria grandinella]
MERDEKGELCDRISGRTDLADEKSSKRHELPILPRVAERKLRKIDHHEILSIRVSLFFESARTGNAQNLDRHAPGVLVRIGSHRSGTVGKPDDGFERLVRFENSEAGFGWSFRVDDQPGLHVARALGMLVPKNGPGAEFHDLLNEPDRSLDILNFIRERIFTIQFCPRTWLAHFNVLQSPFGCVVRIFAMVLEKFNSVSNGTDEVQAHWRFHPAHDSPKRPKNFRFRFFDAGRYSISAQFDGVNGKRKASRSLQRRKKLADDRNLFEPGRYRFTNYRP